MREPGSTRIGIRVARAIACFTFLLGFGPYAWAGVQTIAGQVQVRPGPAQLAPAAAALVVTASYTGDDNSTGTLRVEWGVEGGDYTGSADLPHQASPYSYTITGLSNDTRYQVRVTFIDADNGSDSATVFTGLTPYNLLLHNAVSTGSGTSKWPSGWGVQGGRYGEFTCATCHAGGATPNIKRIRSTLSSGTADPFPVESGTVQFTDARNTPAGIGYGDDSNRSVTRICEACHSTNKYHNLNVGNNSGGNSHNNNSDCMICHPHKQGFKAAGCDTCHGYPPVDAGGLVVGTDVTGSTTFGAHELHAAALGFDCGNCHQGYVMPAAGDLDINFSSFATVTGSYSGQNGVSYNGVTAADPAPARECSNLYCHGGSLGDANASDPTPTWSEPPHASQCGTCHGASAGTPPATSSHPAHAGNGAGQMALACSICHPPYAQAHVDGQVAWQLATADSRLGASATYRGAASGITGNLAPSATYGNCANVSCHTSGNYDGTLTYKTPTWGATIGCDGCHGDGAGKAYPAYVSGGANHVNSNSHTKHIGNSGIACDRCHSATAAASDIKGGTLQHADQTIDVDPNGGNFTWNQGTRSCSNISCHYGSSATWGGPALTCTSCHNNGTNDGALVNAIPAASKEVHSLHVSAPAPYVGSCAVCHGSTGHADGTPSFEATLSYNSTNKNCTNACHSAGAANLWSATGTLGCGDCHGAPGKTLNKSANPPTTGSHPIHSGTTPETVYGDSSRNTPIAGEYRLGCGNCHGSTAAAHVDGTTTLSGNGWASVEGTCDATYCHSGLNVSNARVYAETPVWGESFSGDRCAACHGNSPASGGHEEHQIGFHSNAIYSGLKDVLPVTDTDPLPTGLVAGPNGRDQLRGHGGLLDSDRTANSITMSCYACHNSTVTDKGNDLNPVCGACHDGGATAPAVGTMTLADKSFHVNNQVDVVFVDEKIRTKAQVRDDLSDVLELSNNWTRINSYKRSDGSSYDESPDTLRSMAADYGGWTTVDVTRYAGQPEEMLQPARTCLISCHLWEKGRVDKYPIHWENNSIHGPQPIMCIDCHTRLPK